MQRTPIEVRRQNRAALWTAAAIIAIALPFCIQRWLDGDGISLLALACFAVAGAWVATRAMGRRDLFAGVWLSLALVGSGIAVLLRGEEAPGALWLLIVAPMLATVLVSSRAGALAVAGTWVVLLLAWLAPGATVEHALQGEIPSMAGLVSSVFFAVAALNERSRARGVAELNALSNRLAESEARFRAYAELGNELVSELDERGNILWASPRHEVLAGRSPAELIASYQADSIHAEDLPRLRTYYSAVLKGEEGDDCSVRYLRPDGEVRWLRLSGSVRRNGEGRIRVILHARDETLERQVAEQREALLGELQSALDNVKTLRGIIPICAECKKIRREDGAWEQLELYLAEHSLADFSHGLCDDCLSGIDG
ncbi:MAG: hypothetical protein CL910_21915 [Deltaproteobacteria bacterium]|nr:hypothetical protein [Deltaproteobacteria bacterium]